MPRLCFKTKFIRAIIQGQKTTTIRRWKTCRLKAGDKAFSPRVGWLRIADCQQICLQQLTPADARADGFDSLAELHELLTRIYPDLASDKKSWYRVEFGLCRLRPRDPKARKPIGKPLGPTARFLLAEQIRVKLDKAVQQRRSLAPL